MSLHWLEILKVCPAYRKEGTCLETDFFLSLQVPNTSRVNVRTLSDGPTARQKILVVSIWIFSSLFGVLTCFPGKFVTETADPIAEQLQSTIKPFINPFQDKDYAKGTVKLSYAKVLSFNQSTTNVLKFERFC